MFVAERRTSGGELSVAPSHFPTVPLNVPLVLDLDGTLLRSDLLFESLAAAAKRNPLVLIMGLWWLFVGGRARLKAELAQYAVPDSELIPVNDEVVRLAENEALAGRSVVLATAAHELLAFRIAKRFAFISRTMASSESVNLKGRRKADALRAAYPQGYIYAGDSAADLTVWVSAKAAVTVGVNHRLAARVDALAIPIRAITLPTPGLRVFAKAIRVQQSIKNVLVFAPLFLAGRYADLSAWTAAFSAFVALALVASATYLVNDFLDLADDRRHWTKRNRPLAAGLFPLRTVFLALPVLASTGLLLASATGRGVLALVLLYAAVTLSYSVWLKRVPLLDTLIIAGLFSLRLLIGVVAIGAAISIWLFLFSTALFLSIALAKRHTELLRMKDTNREGNGGRGYRAADVPFVLSMGTGAALSSTAFLSLYLVSDGVHASFYATPQFLWVAPVAIFLWLGRIWLLSQRGELDDDPVAFAVKDRPSFLLGGAVGLSFVLAASVSLPL